MEKIFFGRFCDCIFSRLSFAGLIYRLLPAAIRAELLGLSSPFSLSVLPLSCSPLLLFYLVLWTLEASRLTGGSDPAWSSAAAPSAPTGQTFRR